MIAAIILCLILFFALCVASYVLIGMHRQTMAERRAKLQWQNDERLARILAEEETRQQRAQRRALGEPDPDRPIRSEVMRFSDSPLDPMEMARRVELERIRRMRESSRRGFIHEPGVE